MPAVVFVGTQWGDEGKGKLVDMTTKNANIVVRFQGGNNAGHTIMVNGEQTIVHLLPSGILYPDKVCAIGNGVVLNPQILFEEIDALQEAGYFQDPRQLKISPLTHLIMPYHIALDNARETARGKGKIGTTGRGIGPAYEDRANRSGIRVNDLLDWELFKQKLRTNLDYKNQILTKILGAEPCRADDFLEQFKVFSERLAPLSLDVARLLHQALRNQDKVLFEGAQGTHLDIDHGTYPYVTSSNTVAGNAACGSGIGPTQLGLIVGVVKAYTTRVGGGPFVAELPEGDPIGDHLQQKGAEFGATTGRRRRCGWLDLVVVNNAVRLNGLSSLALTKLDVLSELEEIKICTSYDLNGQEIQTLPPSLKNLEACQPVYETLPGWQTDISQARSFQDLPEEARAYVRRIEELTETPVSIISVGAEREQTIQRIDLFG